MRTVVTVTATDDPNTWNAIVTGPLPDFHTQIVKEPGKRSYWSTYRFQECWSLSSAIDVVVTSHARWIPGDAYEVVSDIPELNLDFES